MAPLVVKYPLDPTGVSSDNLVLGEEHVMVARKVRAIATEYGAFYSESLQVRETSTQRLLTPGVHYYAAELYELPSARYGKEVCAIVIINDETVLDTVTLDYQAVGGEFSTSATAIVQQIENLAVDDRPVTWGNIVGKPSEFPPSHHLHDVGDVFGFEYLVHSVDRVRAAILMGDVASHDEIYSYIDNSSNELAAEQLITKNALQAHKDDLNNPHSVTPTQLNVYTKPQSDTLLAGVNDTLTAALNADKADLLAHKTNTANPHLTTAAQVGAYTKAETDALGSTRYIQRVGDTLNGILTGASANMAMSQDGGATLGSFVCRASGAGDGALAGLTMWNSAYAVKLGVRADGYVGLGGFSRAPWSWYSDSGGNMVAAGNVTAYSDPRLKENVELIQDATGKLKQLDGVYFDWKDIEHVRCKAGKHDIGVLANQVQAVFPEIVTESIELDGVRYLTVAYDKLVSVLIQSVKELSARIDVLEAQP